ncbi:recombinase family protein, partial [Rhizobium sp. CAU 1783]
MPIANIMAFLEGLDLMEQQFLAAAGNDLMARIGSPASIDMAAKRKKLLAGYAEELLQKFREWENLQVSLVAGAGFE